MSGSVGFRFKVYELLNELFEALVARYGRPEVDRPLLDIALEAVCPLACEKDKEYARERLRENRGLLSQAVFTHVLYSVLAADTTVHPSEYAPRLADIITWLMEGRANGESALSLLTDEDKKAAGELVAPPPGTADKSVEQGIRIAELETQVRELREAHQKELEAVKASKEVPPAIVEPPKEEGASPAILRLQAREAELTHKLLQANMKLEAFGHFYNRQGTVVHNARMMAVGARQVARQEAEARSNEFRACYPPAMAPPTVRWLSESDPALLPSRAPVPNNHLVVETTTLPGRCAPAPFSDTVLGCSLFPVVTYDSRTLTIHTRPALVLNSASQPPVAPQRYPTQHVSGRMSASSHVLKLERMETRRQHAFHVL